MVTACHLLYSFSSFLCYYCYHSSVYTFSISILALVPLLQLQLNVIDPGDNTTAKSVYAHILTDCILTTNWVQIIWLWLKPSEGFPQPFWGYNWKWAPGGFIIQTNTHVRPTHTHTSWLCQQLQVRPSEASLHSCHISSLGQTLCLWQPHQPHNEDTRVSGGKRRHRLSIKLLRREAAAKWDIIMDIVEMIKHQGSSILNFFFFF